MENCSPGSAELPADVIHFCQVVPQIIWLCGFPGLPPKAAVSSLAAVMEKMRTELHTGTPQRASTKSCKSEGLQRFIILCSKVTVGGTQIQRPLWKKMGFGSLLQAKTFFLRYIWRQGGENLRILHLFMGHLCSQQNSITWATCSWLFPWSISTLFWRGTEKMSEVLENLSG